MTNLRTIVDLNRLLDGTVSTCTRGLRLFLSVYVDDFKLAGPDENLAKGWKLMVDSGLKLDPPGPLNRYLGCYQHSIQLTSNEVGRRMQHLRAVYESEGYGAKVPGPDPKQAFAGVKNGGASGFFTGTAACTCNSLENG